jgi:hypothetical protein
MDRDQRVALLPVESSSEEEDDSWLAFAGVAVASCHEFRATAISQLQNSDVDSSSSDDDLQEVTSMGLKLPQVWSGLRSMVILFGWMLSSWRCTMFELPLKSLRVAKRAPQGWTNASGPIIWT